MNFPLSWQELFTLQSIKQQTTFLRVISELWSVKIQSIVEIGVFEGKSSKLFRALFPTASLYLIDPWKLYDEYLSEEAGPISVVQADYDTAYENVKKTFAQDEKVKIIRKTSLEALADVPNQVDLVFIDGNHSYKSVKEDIEHWFPKVRSGGILSGHDYDPIRFPGVVQAVDEFFPEGIVIGNNYTWTKHKKDNAASFAKIESAPGLKVDSQKPSDRDLFPHVQK